MNNAVDELSQRLEEIMSKPSSAETLEGWGNVTVMSRALFDIQQSYGGEHHLERRGCVSVEQAVLRFKESRSLGDYGETKYVCVSVSQKFSGWCILEDHELLGRLLIRPRLGSLHQRLRLFSCLLYSFWSFPRDEEETSAAAGSGWLILGKWLQAQRLFLDRAVPDKPRWFSTLNDHSNLLTENPCDRYALDLLQGDGAGFNKVLVDLGVPSRSWLRSEAFVAQIRACAELDDMAFQSHLGSLIDAACGRAEVELPHAIARRCVAILISRYAACSSRPEQIPLRDAAIAFLGTPWLDRAAWDVNVLRGDGHPDDAAREMINSWLKVRLIKDFFGLLSEEQSAEGRRLNYWLGFEPVIRETWFALGADCLNDPRKEYETFRKRACGRVLSLSGGTPPSNNAFLIHLGEYLVVEFGITDNACFLFRHDQLPPGIKKCLNSRDPWGVVDIAELKAAGHQIRFRHHGNWESKFDSVLRPLLGFRPAEPVGPKPLSGSETPKRRPQKPTVVAGVVNLQAAKPAALEKTGRLITQV
jgi:EH_Signature domain